ncbi:unnamed protein product, partial [Amoebophrya sp. A25]|eukprot:GSA25T00009963001.1
MNYPKQSAGSPFENTVKHRHDWCWFLQACFAYLHGCIYCSFPVN